MKVAWKLLPKRVRVWVIVRAHCDATSGAFSNVSPDEVLAFQLSERMR